MSRPKSKPTSKSNSQQLKLPKASDTYLRRCQEVFGEFKDEDFYSNKVQHIYFYGTVDQNEVQKLREAMASANSTKNANANANATGTIVNTKPKPIVIHVHNPGGDAYLGISLANWLRESKLPVAVVVDGYACSAATPLLVSAPYRVMHSQSFVMIHEGSVQYADGKSLSFGDLKYEDTVVDMLVSNYQKIYVQNTKIPIESLKDLLTRDKFLDASTCNKWGIIDRVINIEKKKSAHAWDDYYKRNPELSLQTDPLLWKSNFNHIYLYNNGAHTSNSSTRIQNTMKILMPLQAVLETPLEVKIPKPIVLHSNMYTFPDNASLYDIAAIMIRISLSAVPIIGIIDSDIELLKALPCIMSYKRYMYRNTSMMIQLVYHHRNHGTYYHDLKENTEMLRNTIRHILIQYTKMPPDIMNSLFEKRMLLTAEQCKQYGLIDEIIDPYTRR